MERPRWAIAAVIVAFLFNIFANWVLMFGHLGFPAMGLPGSGLATTLASWVLFAGVAAVLLLDRRFKRYRLFGRFWRPDWQALPLITGGLACRSARRSPSR